LLDLTAPDALRSFAPFDRILVDAPCSATGVIRRHPDIKLLRQPGDVAGFVRTQRAILANAFQVLAPGGRLLYATCSLCADENERLVGEFLAATPAALSLPPPAGLELPPGAVALPLGWQLLPGAAAGTDGFYYASIGRRGG
jgi:16S rRNA (cytosine967-C5)-methyltransferase